MSSEAIRPSTLDGIKRLAKSFKTKRGIQHTKALDDAAQIAGFQNFRHARNLLRNIPKQGERQHAVQCVFLTAYWRDRKNGGSGRETLTIQLTVPWGDLITPTQFRWHRGLAGYHAEGPDHLVVETLLSSQSAARRLVCETGRALQFMDATKLRPSRGHSRAYPDGDSSKGIPGRDHYSVWYEPETKRYLFVDEPYEEDTKRIAGQRRDWASQYGFSILRPEWPGMYAPDLGSRLYLVAHDSKGVPLQPIAAALDKLPTPIVEETWNGESAPMRPYFETPGKVAKTAAVQTKPKVPSKPNVQGNTVGYIQTLVGPQRRPNGRMPIPVHAEVGRLINSVMLAASKRKGVYNRLDGVRSELDDWAQCEYNHNELPSQQFFELYYREGSETLTNSLTSIERELHAESLEKAQSLLREHYPDCQPLRSLLKKIDAAINSLRNWA
ncbi:MAG: DUF5623 domain-containing protein [Pseudomonadota bacterium]|nr:DUF5623 domain-containing protein [Pseudomonadota bacterium]